MAKLNKQYSGKEEPIKTKGTRMVVLALEGKVALYEFLDKALEMSPKQARQLSKTLLRLADEAERLEAVSIKRTVNGGDKGDGTNEQQ